MEIDSDVEQMDWNQENVNAVNLIAGKIVTIELKNFLTHSEATVHPSEQLNLIIGPNGTGKSSIVASIIIGMGGSTKILSERNKLSDYVQNGKDEAQITVIVYKDEHRNLKRFCRQFNRQNKNVYHIDGRKVKEGEYLAEIDKLNVQVGNLCQFLPQERVQDFAKQNPQELFASTQKSVCSDTLNQTFVKLIELRNLQLSGNKMVEKTTDLLRDNERRIELLQTSVDNIHRQDELVRKKNVIEKKLAWMEFETIYLECQEIDKDLTLAQKNHEEKMRLKRDLEKLASDKTKERQKYEKSLASESLNKKKFSDALKADSRKMNDLENVIHEAKKQLDAYVENANQHEQKVVENQIILETYEQDYSNYMETIGSVSQIQKQIAEIEHSAQNTRTKIRSLAETREKFNFQIESVIKPNMVQIEEKIKAFHSVATAKHRFVQNNYPDVYRAMLWLRDNRNNFRGHIYDPLIVELGVRSDEYGKYIENCVKLQDLIAFTCEDTDDMTHFLRVMRVEMKLQVNAIHSPRADRVRFKSSMPISELRKLGGEIFLIDCVEGPFAIINYLCRSYNIHNVLIGNENLERKANYLPRQLQLFFTPTHRVAVKISKYSDSKSLMSSQLVEKNMFTVRMNKRELDQLNAEKAGLIKNRDMYYNKRNEIEANITLLEEQCKSNFQEKGEHQKRIYQVDVLRKKKEAQETKLRRMEIEPFDIDGEKEKFAAKAKEAVKKRLKLHESSIATYEKLLGVELNEVKARARLNVFKNSNVSFDTELMECNDEIDRIKAYCDRIGRISDTKKQEAKEKQRAALKMTENHKPSEGNKFPYKKDFDELSDDRNVLVEEMEDLEQQISCRSSNDQAVLDEYNERVKNNETLKKDLRKGSKSTTELETEISGLHKQWFPQIHGMVMSINGNFGRFMESMSCAGEVELIHPSERDYEQYGIEIRVKYRDSEKMRPLDRFVQSGGERAVAIAVYSLSLQHLSQVPFRCVDEINQGMDPNNERRVFEMLVNNVAQPGQSQFFYVTPKLQTNLPYNDNVTCVAVFNGPYTNHNDFFEDA